MVAQANLITNCRTDSSAANCMTISQDLWPWCHREYKYYRDERRKGQERKGRQEGTKLVGSSPDRPPNISVTHTTCNHNSEGVAHLTDSTGHPQQLWWWQSARLYIPHIMWAIYGTHRVWLPRWPSVHPLGPCLLQIWMCSTLCLVCHQAGDKEWPDILYRLECIYIRIYINILLWEQGNNSINATGVWEVFPRQVQHWSIYWWV
jgi:hypothetical protein